MNNYRKVGVMGNLTCGAGRLSCLLRLVGFCIAAVAVLLSTGCIHGDAIMEWTVSGTIEDAETGAPIPDATITLRLLRDGELLSGEQSGSTDADGNFEKSYSMGFSSVNVAFFIPLPPTQGLGDPPDRIEVAVRTSDDREGSTVVVVLEERVQETEVWGVSLSGTIDVGRIAVLVE